MGWNKIYPLSTTSVCGSVAQIAANWNAIEAWWDVSHQTFTSAGSGTHTIGEIGTLLVSGNSAILATTEPGTGAIGYDTTNGQLLIHRSAGWDRLTADKYSRAHIVFDAQILSGGTWVPLTTEVTGAYSTYDTLGEYSSTTHKFTILNSGYYLIKAAIRWPYDETNNYLKAVGVYKNGIVLCKSILYGKYARTLDVADIVALSTGDYLELAGFHDYASNVTIVNGSLYIIRLS